MYLFVNWFGTNQFAVFYPLYTTLEGSQSPIKRIKLVLEVLSKFGLLLLRLFGLFGVFLLTAHEFDNNDASCDGKHHRFTEETDTAS